MNREIKFRAWDNANKTMIILNGIAFGDCYDNFRKQFNFMQYTGLKDKNGKEIYEGDIVKIYLNSDCIIYAEIKFEDGCFKCIDNSPIDYNYPEQVEVIGNKFENPELLK